MPQHVCTDRNASISTGKIVDGIEIEGRVIITTPEDNAGDRG